MIFLRNVQQHRVRDRMRFAQQSVDADAVIADAGVHIGTSRSHEREAAAETIADDPDLAAIGQHAPRGADRRFGIADAGILIELSHEVERALHLVGNVGVQLDARCDLPEQVGGEREIAVRRQPIAFAADPGVHTEDFLNDDDRRTRRACRFGDIGVETAFAV
ncbi:hypothetical protein WR25_27139 [Diploscapter pachys]|uniref:Uncharacterized protein n=1 Tax=Diploscapter pachys TaxID=2018661 RepID=A0A2A2M405_9BILA|nr:hypothetical protein WR25_27139 [Diploscapter pachys]